MPADVQNRLIPHLELVGLTFGQVLYESGGIQRYVYFAIEYGRGQIKVLDRAVLEKLCCECYSVVRRETDRVMPSPTGYLGRPGT